MTKDARIGKRLRLLALALTAIVTIVVCQALFDPIAIIKNSARLSRIRAELPAAEARWRAQDMSDYEIDVQGSSFACHIRGTLSVRGGELVAVAMREDPSDPTSALVPVDPEAWHIRGCAYEEMTVPRFFERVERTLEEISVADATVSVTFDNELGYVTEYSYAAGYRRGLLNPVISDGWVRYSIEDLRPVVGP